MDEASACLESDGEDGADGLTGAGIGDVDRIHGRGAESQEISLNLVIHPGCPVAAISAWLNMRGGAQITRCRKEHRLSSSGEGHSAIGE